MTIQSVAGTQIKFAVAKPTAETSAAYTALTWVGFASCVLTKVGDFGGKKFSIISTETVCNRQVNKAKGSFEWPEFTCEMLQDITDPAQVLLSTALDADTDISVQVIMPDGKKMFFYGLVTEFTAKAGGVNDMYKCQLTLTPRMANFVYV